MNMITFSQSKQKGRRLLLVPLTAMSLLAGMVATPSYADHHADSKSAKKTDLKAAPDVKLPYSFKCPHCSMKITIKTPADWNKDCMTCACGFNNLGCYHEIKK